MPFTLSHPAAVMPLGGKFYRNFDMTALVLGSMAPDFEYFLRLKPFGEIGHTMLGFIWFNLPLCMILAYLFHYIIKKPLLYNLPSPLDRWYGKYADKGWNVSTLRRKVIFAYSAVIGMITHTFWDSFTHEHGVFVNYFSRLSNKIDILGHKIPVYKILQHGSTLIGASIIFIYLLCIRNEIEKANMISAKEKIMYFARVFIISLIIVFVMVKVLKLAFSLRYIGNLIVISIDAVFIGILASSIIYKLKNKEKQSIIS